MVIYIEAKVESSIRFSAFGVKSSVFGGVNSMPQWKLVVGAWTVMLRKLLPICSTGRK